jgi:hypothetical protein
MVEEMLSFSFFCVPLLYQTTPHSLQIHQDTQSNLDACGTVKAGLFIVPKCFTGRLVAMHGLVSRGSTESNWKLSILIINGAVLARLTHRICSKKFVRR